MKALMDKDKVEPSPTTAPQATGRTETPLPDSSPKPSAPSAGHEPRPAAGGGTGDRRPSEPTGKAVYAPFTELRRLFAVYWRPLVSLVALVPALLAILNKLGLPISLWTEARLGPATQGLLIGLGIAVL